MAKARGWKPPYERILDRLAEEYPEPLSLEECWSWPGSVGSHGYGQISMHGRPELVHRVVYDAVHGLIPEGHFVDHACHNNDLSCAGGKGCLHRRCCNPAHLVTKTPASNSDAANGPRNRGNRKTHCPALHPYDEQNTMWIKRVRNGKTYNTRQCARCNRENARGLSAAERLALRLEELGLTEVPPEVR